MACFGVKQGQNLKYQAVHPYQEFQGVPTPLE